MCIKFQWKSATRWCYNMQLYTFAITQQPYVIAEKFMIHLNPCFTQDQEYISIIIYKLYLPFQFVIKKNDIYFFKLVLGGSSNLHK